MSEDSEITSMIETFEDYFFEPDTDVNFEFDDPYGNTFELIRRTNQADEYPPSQFQKFKKFVSFNDAMRLYSNFGLNVVTFELHKNGECTVKYVQDPEKITFPALLKYLDPKYYKRTDTGYFFNRKKVKKMLKAIDILTVRSIKEAYLAVLESAEEDYREDEQLPVN